MRVCLIPLRTEPRHPSANLERLMRCLAEIAHYQPDLICLPECTFTGYVYHEDDVRRFAEPIPGSITERMGECARKYATYLCFGLLETAEAGVYNSAVILDRTGAIILKHRKIEEEPPFVRGDAVNSVDTELGRLGLLICGDLFNEEVTRKLDPALHMLIVPMARSFDNRSPDVDRWISEERQAYLEAVKAIRVTTLIVNSLEINTDAPSFGGAMVINAAGSLLAESPHGTDQVLLWEFDRNGS
ncbi:MAG: carbon-nitrogen hydrolase family protein [Roseiflexus sp.]